MCTYENHALLELCEICGGKRSSPETEKDASLPKIHLIQSNEADGIVPKIADLLVTSLSYNSNKNGSKGVLRGVSKGQTIQCRVSNQLCNFYSQRGQYGAKWSCGYRNIQMLCSSLMKLPEYRHLILLFSFLFFNVL